MYWFTDTLLRTGLTVISLLAVATVALAEEPAPVKPFDASYEVLRNGKPLGSSRTTLSKTGDQWRFHSEVVGERGMAALAGFKLTQTMDFHWHGGHPRPLRSRYDQQATLGSRKVDVDYDWSGNHYKLVDRKGEHRNSLTDETVDRYGSPVALAARLAAGETDFTLMVAYPDGPREWRFKVTGEETVTVPAGTFRTVRVERIRDDDDRHTTSWHAPERNYLAVRTLQDEDGTTLESRLR